MNNQTANKPMFIAICPSAPSRRVAVTGATGFVGRALVAQLVGMGGAEVLALTRKNPTNPVLGAKYIKTGDLTSENQWQSVLADVHTVVHTAARAHVLNDRAVDPLSEYRHVNTAGTLRLAEHAAAVGVKRFVFLSSIGVNGVQTVSGQPFSEANETSPHNAYAVSKWEAEQGLMQLAHKTGIKVVICRPPLVYGCNAPGNFGSLIRAVQKGWPLPLGAIQNRRSLVALDNLVDFIITCITHPKAANQTFLISDGQDLSTTELVRGMAQAAGVPARLLPVPVWALEWAGRLVGKGDAIQRLCGNLQIDSSKARNLLGWAPKVSVQEGLWRAMLGSAQP